MRHSIAKVNIRITAGGGMDGIALQHEISTLFWNSLLEKMEQLFDRMSRENEIQVIDHLTIDLGNIGGANWTTQFSIKLLEALQMVLQSLETPEESEESKTGFSKNANADQAFQISGGERLPARQRLFDTWLHFLRTGMLPPAVTLPAAESEWQQAILETLATETRAEQQFLQLLRQHRNTARRLALQFEENFLSRIAAVLNRQSLEHLPLLRVELQAGWKYFSEAIRQKSVAEAAMPEHIQAVYSKAGFWETYFLYVAAETPKNRPAEAAALLPVEYLLQTMPSGKIKQLQAVWKVVMLPKSAGNQKQSSGAGVRLTPEQIKAVSETFEGASRSQGGHLSANELLEDHPNDLPAVRRGNFSKVTSPTVESAGDVTAGPFKEPLYVQQAGIVIAHAFLPVFFKTLNLLDDQKQFRSPEARQKAVHAVQFLASGEDKLPEHRLFLPKFLCGLPLEQPIERDIELTEPEKIEADTLLRSLLTHWNALGSASPDGLREGFFDRTGKLSRNQNGLLLQIESRTLDIMLQRLPWSISLIRLPWMKEMLQVDWSY